MDVRVGQLIADIHYAASVEGSIDAVGFRDEIVMLFADVSGEADRVALIELFHRVTDLAAQSLRAQGRSVEPLEAARLSQQRMFCLTEAVIDGAVDPTLLWRVISREADAGRMSRSDTFALEAKASAATIRSAATKAAQREAPARKGWWQRTFGP